MLMKTALRGSMEVLQHCIQNFKMFGYKWTEAKQDYVMKLNLPSENLSWIMSTNLAVTPITNPTLWYSWYAIIQEDAPEIIDTFIENTAAKMEVTVDYFMGEFL